MKMQGKILMHNLQENESNLEFRIVQDENTLSLGNQRGSTEQCHSVLEKQDPIKAEKKIMDVCSALFCQEETKYIISFVACEERGLSNLNTKSPSINEPNLMKDETDKGSLKNFLNFFKKCLSRLIEDQGSSQKEINQEILDILKNPQTNKEQIEKIFKSSNLKQRLAQIFNQRKFQRETQFSRIRPENRKIFREKLCLLKKAFIQSKLTNL